MWTCARCGEQLDADFDQCWRCATQRALTPEEDAQAAVQDAFEAGELEPDELELAPILSPEVLAVERAALTARAAEIARYEGGHLDHRTAALMRIHRGYVLYRTRRARSATGPVNPDHARLDRMWSAWVWGSGATVGLVLALLLSGGRVLDVFGFVAVIAMSAGILYTIFFGAYLASKEIALATSRRPAT